MFNLRSINPYIQASVVAIGMTVLTFTLGLFFGWLTVDTLNWFEVAAVATSYACTWLTYLQKRFSYLIGVVTTALYTIVFFQAGLVASMILNLYLVPTVLFGFFRWRSDSNPKPVQKFRLKLLPVYVLVVGAFYGGAVAITNLLGGTMAPLDSIILVGTILAQFLLDNKVLGNWFVWIFVNIVSIYVYFSQELYFAGVQYVFFLIGAFYGFALWKKHYDEKNAISVDTMTGSGIADDVRGGTLKVRKEN